MARKCVGQKKRDERKLENASKFVVLFQMVEQSIYSVGKEKKAKKIEDLDQARIQKQTTKLSSLDVDARL